MICIRTIGTYFKNSFQRGVNVKIGIIDADLLGRKKHRFPNLACEKISAYWKAKGEAVELLLSYDDLENYDHVYISKVFTDTPVPEWLKETEKIHRKAA